MDFPSFDDLFRIARDEALVRNTQLTQSVIDREGTDANAFVAASAAVGDEVIGQLTEVEAALFLDTAKGDKLTRLVFDRYQLLRKPASVALGSVTFSLPAPAPSSFAIPLNTRLQTPTGAQYLTTEAVTFPAGSSGPVYVAIRSALAGLSQQAQIGTITSIIDTVPGAPAGLTVTNPVATAGADDEERDEELRARARLFFPSARRGTINAIVAAALAVQGVRTANAFEVLDALGRPAKGVTLAVSDAFTEQLVTVAPTPPAYQAQSQILAAAVQAGLYDARAAGIFVNVLVAQVVLQGVQLALSFQAGASVDLGALKARAAVVAYMNSLSPGAAFSRAAALNALRTVPELFITGNEIASPAGDVVAQPLEVLRTTLGLVVAASVQPDQALQGSTNPDAV